jgi:FkbM family methyltransferase
MNRLTRFYEKCPNSVESHVSSIKSKFNVHEITSLKNVVLFGTECLGNKLLDKFRELGVEVSYFSDNDKRKWGRTIKGVRVIPPNKLKKNHTGVIASKYVREIYDQLLGSNLKNIVPHYVLTVLFPDIFPNPLHEGAVEAILRERKEIEKAYLLLSDEKSRQVFLSLLNFRISLSPLDLPNPGYEQYYPGGFWKLSEDETYVDVGAYDGDTLLQFLRHIKGKFRKYIALEPDSISYGKLVKNIPKEYQGKIVALPMGAGAEDGEVAFSMSGEVDSSIMDCGSERIRIVALDELCKNEKVTTIKMDVEGYEPEVLEGSTDIIKKQKPKLTVCLYHRPPHLWQLPIQVAGYNRGYKLYMRHHGPEIYDTILYACM